MSPPIVTALYAALNAVLNIFLASRVSNLRRRDKVSVGAGDSKELLVAIRTHANNAEFVPFALLLMLIAELLGAASMPLHVYGGLLFAARVLHVIGMPRRAPNPYRFVGVGLTWLLIVASSAYLLWLRTKR